MFQRGKKEKRIHIYIYFFEQPKLSSRFKKMQAKLLKLKSGLTKHLSWGTWLLDKQIYCSTQPMLR